MRLREKIQWRPKLRTILMIVNLAVLLLPLGGIYFFRFYENELVRQTESELISQGSFIVALYKKEITPLLDNQKDYGITLQTPTPTTDDYYTPIPALLDLASAEILPPREEPRPTDEIASKPSTIAGKKLTSILKETTRITLSGTRITDHQGIVVSSSRDELGMDYSHVVEVKKALAGQYHSLIRRRVSDEPYPILSSISRGTGIRVYVTFPIILDDRVIGTVMLSRSPKNILKALYDRQHEVYVLITVLILLAAFIALFTSYTINRPIHALINKAKRITSGETNVDLNIDRRITKEVVLLSDSIATMAQTIEERSNYIKGFANAVSHEFKTPLTSMTGTIELLQEHIDTMSKEERDRFFTMIEQDTNRLKNLVQRLLELAKADVIEHTGETSNLMEILTQLQSLYSERGLEITIENEITDLIVPIAPEVLQTIFTNLFDNSLQQEASKIILTVNHDGDSLQVNTVDNGNGIAPENLEKIFTPFFTTNRENGGTGLGLDIVKSLLNRHGGDIEVKECDSGAWFYLSISLK